MNVEWGTNIGYGDFVTGLGYARNLRLRSKLPIDITFHWSHDRDYLFSPNDPETIIDRFEYINSILIPVEGVTYHHKFNSDFNETHRFYNQLDEFNPLHGLSYSTLENETSNTVILWTTRNNITFPGKGKDPVHPNWHLVEKTLKDHGYDIVEVDYRTPVKEVMEYIRVCKFGVGYDGLAHQLFKFMWKPLIVFCHRSWLNNVLIPQACLQKDPKEFIYGDMESLVAQSQKKVDDIRAQHRKYINEYIDVTRHELYNTFIDRSRSYRS